MASLCATAGAQSIPPASQPVYPVEILKPFPSAAPAPPATQPAAVQPVFRGSTQPASVTASQPGSATTSQPLSRPESDVVAELSTPMALIGPDEPWRVRFTLANTTDSAVDVRVPGVAPAEGVGLPTALIFGSTQSPALSVAFDGETAQPLRRPAGIAEGDCVIRLAPRSAVSTELDLRESYAWGSYVGAHHVRWRPLEGRFGEAAQVVRVDGRRAAVLVTDYGKITFTLSYAGAPRNVGNFTDLVLQRFYDGKLLHRVIAGGIVQGGSPDGTDAGMRPDKKTVPAELHDAPFDVGTLAMAHKFGDPDSASCQFFVGLGRLPELDRQYTVIGQARDEESLRTLRQLGELATDAESRPLRPLRIRSIKLVEDDTTPATQPTSRPAYAR